MTTDSLPLPEHAEITASAIILWRQLAELLNLPINGDIACDAIDTIIHTLYDERKTALEFSARLLGDMAHQEMEGANECLEGENFSAEKIALLRERHAALDLAGSVVYDHMKELTETHVHFDPKNSERIKELSDIPAEDEEEKDCGKPN